MTLGSYELIKGDAFAWMKDRAANSIEAVVTDPPYGLVEYQADQLLKRRLGKGGIWRLPQSYDGFSRIAMPRFTVLRATDRERITEFHARFSAQLFPLLVPGAHVFIASQNILSYLPISAFVRAGFELRGQVARVVKTLRGGDRPKGAHTTFQGVSVVPRSCWEPWLIFRKPCEGTIEKNLSRYHTGALRRPVPERPFADLIVASPVRGIERRIAPHPSVKPQEFMRQLVWAALPLGEGVILDPFMGSGSTVAAAAALGLNSIGVEIRSDYFQLSQSAVPKLAKIDTAFDPVTPIRSGAHSRRVVVARP